MVPDALKDKLIYFLDGRKENDVFEAHYRANTKKRILQLADATGFDTVDIKMLVSDAGLAMVPPLAIPELVWIRILMTRPFKSFRSTIIATIAKRAA
jgi:hypothetical protein